MRSRESSLLQRVSWVWFTFLRLAVLAWSLHANKFRSKMGAPLKHSKTLRATNRMEEFINSANVKMYVCSILIVTQCFRFSAHFVHRNVQYCYHPKHLYQVILYGDLADPEHFKNRSCGLLGTSWACAFAFQLLEFWQKLSFFFQLLISVQTESKCGKKKQLVVIWLLSSVLKRATADCALIQLQICWNSLLSNYSYAFEQSSKCN